ncbi:MAG: DMT family transporter [Proteobacteria bacterium]|nr:DMT family transporter [Pseudomonadota bacterium]MBI3499327.1 DMT family transporter [Pseudomonadota bacterium]
MTDPSLARRRPGAVPSAAAIHWLAPADLVLLILLTLFWGFNWPAMKLAVTAIPVWQFRLFSLCVGTLGLLGIARAQGLSLALPRRAIVPLLVCSMLNVVLWQAFSGIGLLYIEAGRASIVAFTMPLWSAVLSWPILGERVGVRQILGLALGLAGLAALIPADILSSPTAWLGILLVLAAAVSWALGTIALKAYRLALPTVLIAGWQLTLAIPPMGLGALLEPFPDLGALAPAAIAGALYAAVIPMIFCHYAWFRLVGLLPASIAAITTLAIPVVGVFSSALVLGESLGLSEGVALGLVVAALAIVLFGRARG